MKDIKLIISILLLITLYNCSTNNETVNNTNSANIVEFSYENYNTVNNPNTIVNRKVYTLENNKIMATTHENLESGYTANRTYIYTNNKISEINRFSEGVLIEKKSFVYEDNGNIIEYLRETTANSNSQAFFTKLNFVHTQDTIFSSISQSENGITYEVVERQKIILDSTNNLVFSETYSLANDETIRVENTYDANNNIISSLGYQQLSNGNFVNSISSSYMYESGINPLGLIYDATFGRQVLMLSGQHIDNSTGLNYYNSKYITTNTFESYTTSFFDNGNFIPEFIHTYNDSNYSTFSDYRFLINDDLFTRFTYEFIYE
jgi:competence protein ComGC